MMKRIFTIAALFVALSCSKVEEPLVSPDGGNVNVPETPVETIICATLPDNMTKVSFEPSYDGGKPQSLALAWEAGDKLRVYNHADKTQYADFELAEESIGKKTGVFNGEVFSAASYDIEVINGEVDYATQVQPADAATASLKYLARATGVTDLAEVMFTEQSSVLAITAKLPEGVAAAIGSVQITASEAIFNAGKTLTISLAEKGDAGEDGILHLFANLPVGNHDIAEGTTLLIRFYAPETDHLVYTRYVELGANSFTAGKLNTINVNATQSDKHAGLTTCDGTSAKKAYLIGDIYQLNAMKDLVSSDATTHFAMVADVDLAETAWNTVESGKVAFDGRGHKISNVTAGNALFATLDGSVQNLVIDGATLSKTSVDELGLIANVTASSVSIKNITVTNSSVTGRDYVGAIAGVLDGDVENVQIDCSVKGGSKIAGMAGQLKNGSLKNIAVSGLITCTYQYAAGLVALMDKGTVENCSSTADIDYTKSASYANVGGLIGELVSGSISNTHATGSVSVVGGRSVGGLIGKVQNAQVTNCYATGDVKSNSKACVGGLIGEVANSATIDGCYATGNVTGVDIYVGGLVGFMSAGTVDNSHSTGSVSSTSTTYGRVGGLIGQVEGGTISGSYATGSVTTAGHYGGGLIGVLAKDKGINVSKCYSTGAVNLPADKNKSGGAGLIGAIETDGTFVISNSYTLSNVTAYRWSAALIGRAMVSSKVTVTNCYVKSNCVFTQPVNCGAFIGDLSSTATLTYSGVIAWALPGVEYFVRPGVTAAPEGSYYGEEGSVSAKAKEFKWDESVWDLSGSEPKLK